MALRSVLGAVALSVMCATAGSAATLTVNSISAVWDNPTSGVSGDGTTQLRWGNQPGKTQSGYDIGTTSGSQAVEDSDAFDIGDFTHRNLPIHNPILQTVDLVVSFAVDGVADRLTSVFSFEHLESANWHKTCANGERNKAGVNTYGCADRASVSLNEDKSDVFELNGTSYVLDVLGFRQGADVYDTFWTMEKKINSAELIGFFRTVNTQTQTATIGSPAAVPLPASWLLLLGGLGGLFLRRKA